MVEVKPGRYGQTYQNTACHDVQMGFNAGLDAFCSPPLQTCLSVLFSPPQLSLSLR
jgi:hypothetical protein